MSSSNVVRLVVETDRLDGIKRRILAALKLTTLEHTATDWVEGSLELALALRDAKDLIPSHYTFSGWLQANQIPITRDNRTALLHLTVDLELMRIVLAETKSRSYDLIWRNEFRPRFRKLASDTPKPGHKRLRNSRGRRDLFREMKLGREAIARIKGTTLDTAAELEELVMLNRGAAPGQLTPLVRQLIEDAVAGKEVSALAESSKLANGRRLPHTLIDAWR